MGDIMKYLFTITLVVLCFAVYYLNSLFAIRNTTDLPKDKHYLLVIAHPDDECMFFSPTVLALTAAGNTVTVLCLSSGNADGIGTIRQKELLKSCTTLGCSKDNIHLITHLDLQDSMTTQWDAKAIAREVANFVKSQKGVSFHAFITFDAYGVSSHPNHTSILPGLKHYVSTLPKTVLKPDLWELLTTNLLRKYSGMFDALPCLVMTTLRVALAPGRRKSKKDNFMTFMNDPRQVLRGQQAMVLGHKSQMRWFRWFWVVIGRYMYFNELRKVIF